MYIGQTTIGVRERFLQHMKPSAHKKSYKFYKAINKYGRENFYYETIEENVPIENLNEREKYWINYYGSYKNGYNSTVGGDGRTIDKIDDIEYIIKQLSEGRTYNDISKELGVCNATIYRALKKYNLTSRDIKGISYDEVIGLYMQNYTHKEIAEKLNIHERSVGRIIKEKNITREKEFRFNKYEEKEIIRLYEDGYGYAWISEIMNIKEFRIMKFIKSKKHQIKRKRKQRRRDTVNLSDIKNDIINDYINNMTIKKMMKKYNLSCGKLYTVINDYKENSNDYPEKE